MQGSVIKGLDIKKVGGCNRTALATHGLLNKDPHISLCLENITHFLEAWRASPTHMTMGIQAVWPILFEKLEGPYRWSRVTGPLSSAIATLLDWHFVPLNYDLWVDPDGYSWRLDPTDANFVAAAKDIVRYHMHRQAWAAITPEGATPGPPDLQPYQLLRKQFGKVGGARQRHFLDAVVQNAMEVHADMHVCLIDHTHEVQCRRRSAECMGTLRRRQMRFSREGAR